MTKELDLTHLDRRTAMQAMGGIGLASSAALVASAHSAQAEGALEATTNEVTNASLTGPYVDLKTPQGNITGFGRTIGDLDESKQKFGYYGGAVMAVMPDKKVQPIFEFHGFSVTRMQAQEDGSWKKLLREVGYYTDLKTGEIMEEWYNPFIDEKVKVVPVANDPFNFHLQETFPKLEFVKDAPDIPFVLDWRNIGDALTLHMDVHLRYPNMMLNPQKWPRESSGPWVIASEMFRTQLSLKDMQNEDLTTLESRGSWNRVTPWLPWMFMGQAPGHILYACETLSKGDDPSFIPEQLLRYTEANYPKFMEAPTEWYEPSLSSIENYAREQTPAPLPVKEDAPAEAASEGAPAPE